MRSLGFTIMILFMINSVQGQDVTHNLSQRQAGALFKLLNKKNEDAERVDILLKLAQYNILKPGSYSSDLDSADSFIKQSESIIAKSRSQQSVGYITLVKGELCKERGEDTVAKKTIAASIGILKHTPDKYHLAEAYYALAGYYDLNDPPQLNKKINCVKQAIAYYEQSGHLELQAFSLKMLADLLLSNAENYADDYKALNAIERSLITYKQIHYQQLQGVYDLYGKVYEEMDDYNRALHYELMALQTAERFDDRTMQSCEINNHIGITYGKLNEFKNAIIYFKKGFKIAVSYHDTTAIYWLATNVAKMFVRLKDASSALAFLAPVSRKYKKPRNFFDDDISYVSIYGQNRQFNKALPYCNNLLNIVSRHILAPQDVNNVYLTLINFYIASGQFSAANKYLILTTRLVSEIGDPLRISRNYYAMFRLDTAQKNYKSAISNLLKGKQISDSLFNEIKSRQQREIEVQYETEKKENQLKIKDQSINILNQKNQLQQNRLQQANLVRNVTIGGILALFVIVFLLFRQYRHKQQGNILISQKNEVLQHLLKEKEWLLKEVHHRVKNNLHTVICLLESQAAYLENDALKAIESSQHRIYAMSLIHQKLYQSADVKTIDMSLYLPEFVQYLNDGFGTQRQIRFQLAIEPLMLGLSQAIPIALIINESVTNSIKYAFPENRNGTIAINMHQINRRITLVITDDGVGINPEITNNPSDSLGLKLINGLSEDINATIKFVNDNGTRITIMFNADPLNDSNNLSTKIKEKEVYS